MKGVAFNAPTEQVWLDIIYVYMFFLALRAPPLSHLAKPRSFYFSATLKNLRFSVTKVSSDFGNCCTPKKKKLLHNMYICVHEGLTEVQRKFRATKTHGQSQIQYLWSGTRPSRIGILKRPTFRVGILKRPDVTI